MAVIHVEFKISVQGGATFFVGGRGGLPAPHAIAGSATAIGAYQPLV